MTALKIYHWLSFRREAPGHHNQTDEIVAAKSKAEVGRIVGDDPRRLFNLGETGNAEQIAVATAKPGTVFWRGIDDRHGEWTEA